MTLITWVFLFPSWIHQLWIESIFWTLVAVIPFILAVILNRIFIKYFGA